MKKTYFIKDGVPHRLCKRCGCVKPESMCVLHWSGTYLNICKLCKAKWLKQYKRALL